jgi:hypothetical protein
MSMSESAIETDLRRKAEQRVAARFGFYLHAAIFLAVNLGLLAINLALSPQYLWFPWPLFGWGIGLVAHGLAVFARASAWRERAVAAELERLRRA